MRSVQIVLLLLSIFATQPLAAQSPVSYVDPFIGTANGGNTFPGAVVPWGMVSVSPHNAPESPSGYLHGEPHLYGVGHTHLSGTGCADYGSVLLMVVGGELGSPGSARTPYRGEAASPGYYRVELDSPAVILEATATLRTGMTRIIAREAGTITLLLNAGTSLGITGGGEVRFITDQHVVGYNIGGGMCGESNRHLTHFSMRVEPPPSAVGTWTGETVSVLRSAVAADVSLGAWLRYEVDKEDSIVVRVGISYVSADNGEANLIGEQSDRGFTEVRSAAEAAWRSRLSTISIPGGSHEQLTSFYTALYHSLTHPNIIDDVNGEYPLMGRSGTGMVSGRHRYSVFSLWDTYRTLHPLLTLLYPEVQGEMAETMVDMYKEAGWLPKWELGANETYLMVGDPAATVLSDTYVKGVTSFDAESGFQAIMKATTIDSSGEAPLIRPGYHDLARIGYIPADQDTTEEWWVWGPVSTMLEYCLADAAAARFAEALGHNEEAQVLSKRSLFYRQYFDVTTGFLRPKNRDGSWMTPFDPLATEGSGSWAGSGGPGYVEGSAWNYTWFVPHDVEGLAALFGGKEAMVKKLDECFFNGTFTSTNEPDIGYPYTYAEAGWRPERTRRLVADIMKSGFTTGPSGLPGNDDAGAISAWYVFSALGFYPFFPGTPDYVLGTPLFPQAQIRLPNGRTLSIEKVQTTQESEPIPMLNGRQIDNRITHQEILAGGMLTFPTQ